MDLSLTYQLLKRLTVLLFNLKTQHNKERELRENQDQIHLTFAIFIEKLHSSFFHTLPFDACW